MSLEETTINLKTNMTAHRQNRERWKASNEKNLKVDYTSRQQQAQGPEVRGLEVSLLKIKTTHPKGKKKVLE